MRRRARTAPRPRREAGARALLVAGVLAGAIVASAVPATAEAQSWTAEARLGQLDFRFSPEGVPPATTLGLGLSFVSPHLGFQVSAGVPMGDEDPHWGAMDLRNRSDLDLGPVTLGLETSGQAFAQRYTRSIETPGGPFQPPTIGEETSYGWGVAAQALPFVAAGRGAVRLEARAGGSYYQTALDGVSATRSVGLGELRGVVAPTRSVALIAEGRHYLAPEGGFTFAGIGTFVALASVDLWANVGTWLDGVASTTPYAAGVAWRPGSRLELVMEARQDALDPVYGSTARRAWSMALRLRLAGPPAPAEPVPAAYDGTTATIILPAGDAGQSPRIAGDFNRWTPEPMERRGDRWEWRGRLEPGVYEYAFVDAEGEWFVPESVPGRKDDGMGGWVALLVVEERGP